MDDGLAVLRDGRARVFHRPLLRQPVFITCPGVTAIANADPTALILMRRKYQFSCRGYPFGRYKWLPSDRASCRGIVTRETCTR